MVESTRNSNSATQAVEATQNGILDLLNDLKITFLTSEALGELCHRLSSVEKVLGRFASILGQSGSYKLSI